MPKYGDILLCKWSNSGYADHSNAKRSFKIQQKSVKISNIIRYMMLYDHAGGLTQNMQIIPMPRVVDGLQQRHQCIAVAALPKNIKHKKTFNPFSWTYTMVTPPR